MKAYRDMTSDELEREKKVWMGIITSSKGPGTPSNDARRGAEKLYEEAAAWHARRQIEDSRIDTDW